MPRRLTALERANRSAGRAQLLFLARDIGQVMDVAARPAVKSTETRQMIVRLNQWRDQVLDIANVHFPD
jgi:hypothetical protein